MIHKYRIIVFDGDKHDRALLALALRSGAAAADVLEATSIVEIAHHVSAGPIDAVVGDPAGRLGEFAGCVEAVRRRQPGCLFWLFAQDAQLPQAAQCVGLGIDGMTPKTSEGFLKLPGELLARLRLVGDLREQLAGDYGATFQSIYPGATAVVGRDGRLLSVSREFEALAEAARFELVGRPAEELWAEPERRQEWRRRLIESTGGFELAGRVKTSRARSLTAVAALKPLHTNGPDATLWTLSLVDVSAALAATAAAQPPAADTGLRDADLERALCAVSHDLQAPLNSLRSQARWLKSAVTTEAEEVCGAVVEIEALTERMQEMLDGMVQAALVGTASEEPEAVNLDAVIKDAIDNLRSQIDESAATIERLPMPTLRVRRQQMVQVFQNLIGNAIKFRSSRIPRIRISAEEAGDCLRILVEDNGIGLDPKDAPRIFGMFQRLHSAREYPGVGAGLAICRQIVRAHGGEISVESVPGRGSCFIIEFRGAALRSVISSGGGRNEAAS